VKRIAYDADTQRYTFRDRSGQMYQNAPGEMYGVLKPVSAPAAPRRNVTITGELITPSRLVAQLLMIFHMVERKDPALIRARSVKRPAVTFDDFLPPEYITNAEDTNTPPPSPIEKIARVTRKATLPKIRTVTGVMRRRTSSSRSASVNDEKRPFLDDYNYSPLSYMDEEKDMSNCSNSFI